MAFMTAVTDEPTICDQYSAITCMNSVEGLIGGDMHVQNDPNAFVVQNAITDLNASQPLRNDNEILSSDQFTLNQETHFLSDYGSGFTTNVSVYHDQVSAPLCAGNQQADFSLVSNENDGFFSNSSHPVETNNQLENDIKAFLSKTSEPKEYKLREDIDNFVKNNSKAADKRMSEDIKAFLRRCRSPSPIEGAKLKPVKVSTKSIYTRISRNTKKLISKSKAFSPESTCPKSPPRKPLAKASRPKSVVTRRTSTNSNFTNKKVNSRSRSHERTPNVSRRKTYSRSRSRERSPNLSKKKIYSRSKSREKSPVGVKKRTYSRSRSRERIRKPLRESVGSNNSKPLPSRNSDRNSRDSKPRETRSQSYSKDSKDAKTLHPYQRRNRQEKSNELKDHERKLETLSKLKPEEIIELEKKIWTKAELLPLYYRRQKDNKAVCEATPVLLELLDKFEDRLIKKPEAIRASKPPYDPPYAKKKFKPCNHNHHKSKDGSSSSSCSSSEEEDEDDSAMKILETKHKHPQSLHKELWFNDPGQMNDGVLCRCSAKAARSGIRHGIYQGETSIKPCNPNTNNLDRLYHYRITLSPPTNFLTKMPTIIEHDDHEYIFEGFSMFTHEPIGELPTCKVIRFNINYAILYIEEEKPENFVIRELDLFYKYVFHELLELVDFTLRPSVAEGETCPLFHFMPRFVRELPENGKEILSMGNVMKYLLRNYKQVVASSEVRRLNALSTLEWQDEILKYKGMIVTLPGAKPSSVRVDQLNRDDQKDVHPEIVHFGIRPPQLSYAGNPEYQKAWRAYVKFRHLIANMPKPSFEDKRKLEKKEQRLQEMRTQSKMKRGVTVVVSSKNFLATGIMCDVVQHAMLLPVLVCHLRFHRSLQILEESIGYKFKNRYLLQLAMTHPSFRENFGTNPDHARNSLTNCGIRQPEYGDRRIHYMNTRKRGINTLINIMSRFGKKSETESNISHNERLEFLGDAVVEFITSIHLYHMFPDLEEGGLATYRAAIVQNQHLAVLAKVLNLQDYMLYAHGSDLCHELELRHAMANCFEALMGALFLDGGIEVPDKVFGEILFKGENELLDVWVNYPAHPLQEQEPDHDRHWIQSFPLLQRLTQFEETIGVEFNHIRLLARAFTDRSVGYTNLTLGSNQRMEFLGDTVLQLIASDYLYRYFPEHHEGHLSLLRSSLVNNRTQSVVCDDLNIPSFALYSNPKAELKTKDRADLLESFLGALYIDKGLEYCRVFCNVCFFPRLQDFIMHQDWNDPKSKLQQCCLTLRTLDGGEPDIPIYKVIECKGPTNSRIYTVAVYFRRQRLAEASGHSIQQAEMNAANSALEQSHGLFPQLDHQKRVIAKSMICNGRPITSSSGKADRPSNNLRSVVQRRDIRDRFKRANNFNNLRTRRVNKQLGAKSALDRLGGKVNEPPPFKKDRDHKTKPEPGRRVYIPNDKSQRSSKFDEDYRRRRTDETETARKYDDREKKERRDLEEEVAETERKEKIRKKISKIKNLGSKAAREKERLKKQKKILKLKKRLKLQLKVKKRLKAKEKLRKVLLSADKLKRRLQLREKNLERQAYEIELKRKMIEENLKKQSNIIEVDRMRLILKGASGNSAAPGGEDASITSETGAETTIKSESVVSVLAPESTKKEIEPEAGITNEESAIIVKSDLSESCKTGKIKANLEAKPSISHETDSKNALLLDPAAEQISSDEEPTNDLNPSSPTSKEVLKLKTILEDIDKTKSEIKEKLDKRKKKDKGKKKKSTKEHDKSASHDNDKKSVLSKSSKSNKNKSPDSGEGSSHLSRSPDHKRSRKESESSKSHSSRKKDRSRSRKRESTRKSVSPLRPRRGKILDSPSPVKRKGRSKDPVKPGASKPSPRTKDNIKPSMSKVSPRARDVPHKSPRSRPTSRRSKSRSPYKGSKKRLSRSNSPKRSQRRRESRSLSLSLSPQDKRHKNFSRSKSRSRSRGRYFNRHRSKSPSRSSRSPTSKFSKKSSRSSRVDQDEYIKYITNMSQSVCAGCTAGTCQMNSSHLVVPPNPHMPPMYGSPHMGYGPPPPHMYNRYPPPGAMRGPPPMRPHRFPVRGPPPPGAPPYPPRPSGPPGPGPGPYAAPPYYPAGPPGSYYPPAAYPGPGVDPNLNGPPNYWT